MRHIFLILSLSLIVLPVFAQQKKQQSRKATTPAAGPEPVNLDAPPGAPVAEAASEPDSPNKIFRTVEQQPEFPGGNRGLYTYLSSNLRYPAKAVEDNIQGKVIVQFVVCEDGSLCDERIVRSISKDCDQEALRVIKAMPRWKPGKYRGKAVKVYYTQPISFRLMEDEPKQEGPQK